MMEQVLKPHLVWAGFESEHGSEHSAVDLQENQVGYRIQRSWEIDQVRQDLAMKSRQVSGEHRR